MGVCVHAHACVHLIVNTLIGDYVYIDCQIKSLVAAVKYLPLVVGYRYTHNLKTIPIGQAIVTHTFNLSTHEAEAGRTL